jgi:hypothetical protein
MCATAAPRERNGLRSSPAIQKPEPDSMANNQANADHLLTTDSDGSELPARLPARSILPNQGMHVEMTVQVEFFLY